MLLKDLKYAGRTLRNSPMFTLTAAITIGLCGFMAPCPPRRKPGSDRGAARGLNTPLESKHGVLTAPQGGQSASCTSAAERAP